MLDRLSSKHYALIIITLLILTAVTLLAMGHDPICKCGEIRLWVGDVNSSQSSQQISDWYTPSHIIHGFLFYALFWWLGRLFTGGVGWPVGFRLVLSVVLEAAWEILENSSFVINRYREATIALDYFGDSVLNSIFDILWMMFGFWLAGRLPVWLSIVLIIAMEVIVGAIIRDNLTLNVIMLLHPIDSIKEWQLRAF
ncbi:hypothetical protein PsAD2_00614 [Pseudovibrio axinellae]|uniref:Uncharacterized protein n=1 Tax=Pseudovibrio axinellae TaxID=989403 RepID=A0A161XHD6_9HYPH|nr:DUF2585 family protein [Pseudovibrio axinellae]KZL21323.1 hypothetical protein PsAD2_00614 [Pseudovibrio axinellae]SEQ96115.1 Protein of unknown function [Pseudovibrio axinellae]